MNNSYQNKPLQETNQENLVCFTTTTKSSIVIEKRKFAIKKDEAGYDQDLLKNKISRSSKKIS
jgi:hypothetical protein